MRGKLIRTMPRTYKMTTGLTLKKRIQSKNRTNKVLSMRVTDEVNKLLNNEGIGGIFRIGYMDYAQGVSARCLNNPIELRDKEIKELSNRPHFKALDQNVLEHTRKKVLSILTPYLK